MKIRLMFIIMLIGAAIITMGMKAVPTQADFSCSGLKIGDDYTAMEKILGKPWYSDNRFTYGIAVDYYMYRDKTCIGIDHKSGKIVDIIIADRKYSLSQDVKIGATPYKIQSVFGKNKKSLLNGNQYYIYTDIANERKRLLLQLDPMEDYLIGIRITSLPLDDEDADSYSDEPGTDPKESNIDTSAITAADKTAHNIKLGFNYKRSW